MSRRLEGKVAIITGATSGIGKATAVLFAEEGAKVVFCGRRENLGKEVLKEITDAGNEALFIPTDVTKTEDLRNLVDETVKAYGTVDILFNNAGRSVPFKLEEIDMKAHYDEIFNLNIRSYFELTSMVVPYMVKQEKGAVINTSSLAGIEALDAYSSYCSSKGAVNQFTKAAAAEFAGRGVRINAIVPGLVNTDLIPEGCEFEKLILPSVPMRRCAKPVEIANVALFLASDQSSYCTGCCLVVDSGKSIM